MHTGTYYARKALRAALIIGRRRVAAVVRNCLRVEAVRNVRCLPCFFFLSRLFSLTLVCCAGDALFRELREEGTLLCTTVFYLFPAPVSCICAPFTHITHTHPHTPSVCARACVMCVYSREVKRRRAEGRGWPPHGPPSLKTRHSLTHKYIDLPASSLCLSLVHIFLISRLPLRRFSSLPVRVYACEAVS